MGSRFYERHELARLDIPTSVALDEHVVVAPHEAHDELAVLRRAYGLCVRLVACIRRIEYLDRGIRHHVIQVRRRLACGFVARATLLKARDDLAYLGAPAMHGARQLEHGVLRE